MEQKRSFLNQPVNPFLSLLLIFALGLLFYTFFNSKLLEILSYQEQQVLSTPQVRVKPRVIPTLGLEETANWETYINSELKYEFKFPSNWTESQTRLGGSFSYLSPKKGTEYYYLDVGFISQSQLNMMGISYCAAYPNDTPRCEQFAANNVNVMIDWGLDTKEDNQTQGAAWIINPNGGIITFDIKPVNYDTQTILRQILSTFKFLSSNNNLSSLPEVVLMAQQDLAKILNINKSEIDVVSVEKISWPDSGLGCHEKGFNYLMVVTPGYKVTFSYKQTQYVYGTNKTQLFKSHINCLKNK